MAKDFSLLEKAIQPKKRKPSQTKLHQYGQTIFYEGFPRPLFMCIEVQKDHATKKATYCERSHTNKKPIHPLVDKNLAQ